MVMRSIAVVTCVVALSIDLQARAGQCEDWRRGRFEAVENGTPGEVYCALEWDPDGSGPQPQMLYVGGHFQSIGGIDANGIAAWDGASWQKVGTNSPSGPDVKIRALAVYNGALIAGGQFTTVGSGSNAQNTNDIARWTGSDWEPLGTGVIGGSNAVTALAVYNGDLIVGGSFDLASGVSAHSIARWDGTSWHPLGAPGSGVEGGFLGQFVYDLQVYNGELFVAGNFETAGGVFSPNVARWNGTSWLSAQLSGLGEWARALEIHNGQLYAGGKFSGGIFDLHDVARWTGSGWAAVGGGVGTDTLQVYDLKSFAGQLYAAGDFTSAAGAPGNLITKWNGTSWSSLGGFLTGTAVYGLGMYAGVMAVCGDFDTAGAVPLNGIGKWNAASWSPFWWPAPKVYAVTQYGSDLILGGDFIQSATDMPPATCVARWTGTQVHSMGGGIGILASGSEVRALKSYSYGSPVVNELVAGGEFTIANGVGSVYRIARWRESPPPNFSTEWEAMGTGFNSTVYAIERHNGITYAGGQFVTTGVGGPPLNRIAQWNNATGTWSQLGTGMNGTVYALRSYNGSLYAGGSFTTAGGVNTGGLARWNGAAWSQVGGTFNGTVYALEVHNGELVIGGIFTGINSSPNIAKYNGSIYSTFGTGGTNGAVRSLTSTPLGLYIGGDFTTAGGINADHIALWNGSAWSQVHGGADAVVHALADFHDEVHAGGEFITIRNGTYVSPGWGIYHETGAPWIAGQPQSAIKPCGTNFTPDIDVAYGYSFGIQWRKDGVDLVNGPTPWGSTIIGVNGNFAVQNVSDADEGDYDCVISNGCGSVTTDIATLTVIGCCPADIAPPNGDNVVNTADLLAVINAWGACSGCVADINNDGLVNTADLLMVINGWGPCQ